jgi:hypothetical protein
MRFHVFLFPSQRIDRVELCTIFGGQITKDNAGQKSTREGESDRRDRENHAPACTRDEECNYQPQAATPQEGSKFQMTIPRRCCRLIICCRRRFGCCADIYRFHFRVFMFFSVYRFTRTSPAQQPLQGKRNSPMFFKATFRYIEQGSLIQLRFSCK